MEPNEYPWIEGRFAEGIVTTTLEQVLIGPARGACGR